MLQHKDLFYHSNGQVSLKGDLLQFLEEFDGFLLRSNLGKQCQNFSFPSFIPAKELNKVGYFQSFPHLATFPINLKNNPDNLQTFSNLNSVEGSVEKGLKVTEITEVNDVLTPAACYHFYPLFSDSQLEEVQYLSTRCVCHRREIEYNALLRQWSFKMREFVSIGSSEEVKNHLKNWKEKISRILEGLKIPFKICVATDPFFGSQANPKFIMQKLDPVKYEFIYQGHDGLDELAIASLNFHKNTFGEAFNIKSKDSEIAFSSCAAFGLERWLSVFLNEFGPNIERWPDLNEVF